MKKHFYYVGVLTCDGSIRLVTEMDNIHKTAKWERNKKPLKMSKDLAEDIVFGLCLNLTTSFIVTSLFELDEQIGTREGETV